MEKLLTILLIFPIACFGADQTGPTETTYVQCLEKALAGNHSLNLQAIRSLCEEISGTQEPNYSYTESVEGDVTFPPSNAFTRCYDYRKQEYEILGNAKAGEIAKIVCRYDSTIPE